MEQKGNTEYKLEVNKIFCMDCMEFLQKLPENSIHLILTDPPYGIRYQNNFTSRKHEKIQGDDGIAYLEFSKQCYRVLRENSHAYFFTRFDCYPYHYECLHTAGFQIKNCLVIEKGTIGGIGDLYGSFANNAEWIIFCHKGRKTFMPTQLVKGKYSTPDKPYNTRLNSCWFGDNYPNSTYNSTWQRKNGIYHPTIKNIMCMEWLIQLSTSEKEIVFDPFLGTGTTAIAAKNKNRYYIGCEIKPEYFQIAQKQLNEVR